MKKHIKISLLALLSSIIVGFFLLVAVYCLPIEIIQEHAKTAVLTFEKEGPQPSVIEGFNSSKLDFFTDSLMLNHATYMGDESPLLQAALVNRYSENGKETVQSNLDYLKNGYKEGLVKTSYGRYWHGYLLILKPLLMIANYSTIRVLNFFTQLSILIFVAFKIVNSKLKRFLPAFFIMVFFSMPLSQWQCLQFSSVYYISMLGVIAVLTPRLKGVGPEIFLLLGVLTSYFDLLTTPLLTLSIPLAFAILIEQEESNSLKITLKSFFVFCVCWGLGYGLMWGSKWLISSCLTGKDFVANAVTTAEYWTDTEKLLYSDVLKANFGAYTNKVFIAIIVVFTIYYLGKMIINHDLNKRTLEKCVPFLLMMLFPFVWYYLLESHSFIHWWMVFRNIEILVFSFSICLILLAGGKQVQNTM